MKKTLEKHIKKYINKRGFPINKEDLYSIFNIKNPHPILSKIYPKGYVLINFHGDEVWWKNGKLHGDGDKPAIIFPDGGKKWYKNGVLHRDGDKPAVININGTKVWWKNGKIHRDGGKPAATNSDGRKEWWENDTHRYWWMPFFHHSLLLLLYLIIAGPSSLWNSPFLYHSSKSL